FIPPSTIMTCPVVYGKLPVANDATAFPTSSGIPHLGNTQSPSEINLSYFSVTFAVISVATIPGRTSYTGIKYSPRRAANSWVAILIPALPTQYSPRLVETTVAEMDEMLISAASKSTAADFCSTIQFAAACDKKYGPVRL